MKYCRLTQSERYQIEALLQSGASIRFISKQLKRDASTISREVRKWKKGNTYTASDAEKSSQVQRHRLHLKRRKIKGELERYIQSKIKLDWSPEQISGRMVLEKKKSISYLTIYRYIERDKAAQGRLWSHLRILRRKHKNRKSPAWNRRIFLPDRVPIGQRPAEVENRNRLGDYERDTVLGKRGRAVFLTIVDRTSRVLSLAWMAKNTSSEAHKSTVWLLKKEMVKTITNDNGFEFMFHKKTSRSLKAPIFFSKAYRSWERGTNENTNGLLRQYFPKKKDIGMISRKEVKRIESLINSRPRKIHGYHTPLEIYKKMKTLGGALAV